MTEKVYLLIKDASIEYEQHTVNIACFSSLDNLRKFVEEEGKYPLVTNEGVKELFIKEWKTHYCYEEFDLI